MSTPNKTNRKPAGTTGVNRIAKPALGGGTGGKGKGRVYEVPKPVRPKPMKK